MGIRRRLADPVTGNPTAYEPDLAASLTVWAWILSMQQDLFRALRATSEAVEIYRKLVALAPRRFTQPLRAVIRLQADVLDGLGRIQDAQTVRDWLAANPDEPDSHK
ncbi:hypothetical protein ACFW9N_29520 [Streptomyces sp. NPDC059496]|uniref:hypothetical protein n=1 Tax=Streptomyces sp. NPDC059496 TaxID=3346851 RepID=UPI0036C0B03E